MYTVYDVKKRIQKDIKNYTGGIVEKGLRGAIIGAMNKYTTASEYGDKNYYRRRVLAFLFDADSDEMSTHKLTDDQWFALYQWVEPWKDEDDMKWKTREKFPAEMASLFHFVCVKTAMNEYEVTDPLFDGEGQPSETIRFLLSNGGKITEVSDDVIGKSLLDNTNFAKYKETIDGKTKSDS